MKESIAFVFPYSGNYNNKYLSGYKNKYLVVPNPESFKINKELLNKVPVNKHNSFGKFIVVPFEVDSKKYNNKKNYAKIYPGQLYAGDPRT